MQWILNNDFLAGFILGCLERGSGKWPTIGFTTAFQQARNSLARSSNVRVVCAEDSGMPPT
jgi:hypothetical protein